MQGLIIDTVGVEIEGCFLNRDELIRNLSSKFGNDLFNKIQVSRDASVEMRVINNLNDSFVHHSRETRSISRGSGNVAGFELITYPLSIDEMEKIIFKVLPELSLMGEVESKRAALHVHVGFPSNLNSIKNLIKCGEILDPLLFKIAGFGKAYRGKINHSVYAFPITAGPIVKNRDNYYRILDIKKALKVESFQDFWKTYGISSDYAFPEVNRYSPGRYIAFNLFSMLLRQTVEFRHFNSTLNPTYAIAVIKLCQLIAEFAMKTNLSFLEKYFKQLDLFSPILDDEYIELLYVLNSAGKKFSCNYILDKETLEVLKKIIRITPQYIFSKENVLTHLREYSINNKCLPYLTKVDSFIESGFIDVHNIQNLRIVEGLED